MITWKQTADPTRNTIVVFYETDTYIFPLFLWWNIFTLTNHNLDLHKKIMQNVYQKCYGKFYHIDGLGNAFGYSSLLAMELPQSYTKHSIYKSDVLIKKRHPCLTAV